MPTCSDFVENSWPNACLDLCEIYQWTRLPYNVLSPDMAFRAFHDDICNSLSRLGSGGRENLRQSLVVVTLCRNLSESPFDLDDALVKKVLR